MAQRKTPLLILTALILFGVASLPFFKRGAQALSWQKDYEQALKHAQSENQLLIAYLFTDWCGYCRKMEKNTFSDADVIATMGQEYTWLRLNAETDPDGVRLKERFGISGYPAVLVLDSLGSEMDRIEGYMPPDRFKSAIELLQEAESQPESHEARYELGERYLERQDFAQASTQFSTVVRLEPRESIRQNRRFSLLSRSEPSISGTRGGSPASNSTGWRVDSLAASCDRTPWCCAAKSITTMGRFNRPNKCSATTYDIIRSTPSRAGCAKLMAELGPQPIGMASSH